MPLRSGIFLSALHGLDHHKKTDIFFNICIDPKAILKYSTRSSEVARLPGSRLVAFLAD